MASLVFGTGGLGDEAGGLRPPLASPALIGLACPDWPHLPLPASPAPVPRVRARHCCSALGSGFGSRHGVFLPSLSYISLLFSFSCIDRQLSFFVLSFSFALNRLPPLYGLCVSAGLMKIMIS